MKTIFSPRKQHYLKRVSFLLIAVALVAAMVSCDGTAPTYNLTMAADPDGCGTATDETGTSPYERNTVVQIKAVPDPCCRFVDWSTTAGTFGNASNATTTFTIPAEDVTVTANFEPVPPDHFKFYWLGEGTVPIEERVQLVDQFGAFNATVGAPGLFGNPVKKVHGDEQTPISDDKNHYMLYELLLEEEPQSWLVTVTNQFTHEPLTLTVEGPVGLAVPTKKEPHEAWDCLDHLLVYTIWHPIEYVPEPIAEVDLYDQFHNELAVPVYEPVLFANPVQKEHPEGTVTEIKNPQDHWLFYPIDGDTFETSVQIDNQFQSETVDLFDAELLAVPSQKIDWEQPLNHFKTYWADWPLEPPLEWEPPLPADVQLKDQFVNLNATVWEPFLFANPVEKWVSEFEWTPIWDPKDHLTVYWIDYAEDAHMWEVLVNNQFGNNQWLQVIGPIWLAVPTGKLAPDWPPDLNHYLVYYVYDYDFVPEVGVLLYDQFTETETVVGAPEFFFVPAHKTHPPGGPETPIVGDDHVLFYWIGGGLGQWPGLPVINQFGQQYLDVEQDEIDFLGVPSKKIEAHGPFPAPD